MSFSLGSLPLGSSVTLLKAKSAYTVYLLSARPGAGQTEARDQTCIWGCESYLTLVRECQAPRDLS